MIGQGENRTLRSKSETIIRDKFVTQYKREAALRDMSEEQSEELGRCFQELRHAEAAAGAQARHANERRKHYRSAAWMIIGILLFTLGVVLWFLMPR